MKRNYKQLQHVSQSTYTAKLTNMETAISCSLHGAPRKTYWRSRQVKAVLMRSSGQMGNWWYPLRRSRVEKTEAPERAAKMSRMRGIGKLSSGIRLFSGRGSMQTRWL